MVSRPVERRSGAENPPELAGEGALVAEAVFGRDLYDDPRSAPLVVELKERLADLRTRVGDTGEHFPKAEVVVRKFWGYDGKDRARAVEISAEFLRLREAELAEAAKAKGKGMTK